MSIENEHTKMRERNMSKREKSSYDREINLRYEKKGEATIICTDQWK